MRQIRGLRRYAAHPIADLIESGDFISLLPAHHNSLVNVYSMDYSPLANCAKPSKFARDTVKPERS